METLEKHLEKVRIPSQSDGVYKDECLYSFDTPESPGGLLICLFRFLGFGEDNVGEYIRRTGCSLFLRLRRRRVKKDAVGPTATKVSRLAIGEPGGFTPEASFEESSSFCLFQDGVLSEEIPSWENSSSIPEVIQNSMRAILSADSAFKRREMEREASRWDGELLVKSRFAEGLKQAESPPQVTHGDWKCERCDLNNNLWLNLTTGAILCGRKNFDGSGGNNHAVDYYDETKHPLSVKLGTITKDGKADVYSYPEDNMVLDPYLKEHLAHFGLNIELLDKTDKSMVEMEIDMNQRIGEWATLTESGSKLTPVFGPSYTGLQSLGNTCYLNSVMQVLMSIPQVASIYESAKAKEYEKVRFDASFADNLDFQLCRLTEGLRSGKYSVRPPGELSEIDADESQPGIRPTLFKEIVGKGHPDFSGSQQQDAQMFFLHLLTVLERHSKLDFPGQPLQFEVEDRIQCGTSGHVKYIKRVEDYLPIPIPTNAAINQTDVDAYLARKKEAGPDFKEEILRPIIPFEKCLESFCQEEIVPDFRSSALNGETTIAKKTMRLKTFPDYLFIQMKKFDADPVTHQPFKLNVEVPMPDEIDISSLKTKGGLQSGEVELADVDDKKKKPDEAIVSALADMGFSLEGCKKAAVLTGNVGVEAAMNWVMEHMEDPDFNDPLVDKTQEKDSFTPSPETLAMVTSMGFSEAKAAHALKKTDGNVERAIEWIFSHPEEGPETDAPTPEKKSLTDGSPKYKLKAFISHMGTSHLVGHYVCHIKKDDAWVIFNDNKVALSEKPPKSLAYLYLYQRM
eukprot:TRINITY_DN5304_c0_g1_i1.p1 TRINITY_DN5304_c0_g1~~TRINITY_DN5304_c0_g1_i1.p1  ORF type:complete len:795 (-),score=285.40 TRINITY_DN5304_c0_g1_i1:406-2790(-)